MCVRRGREKESVCVSEREVGVPYFEMLCKRLQNEQRFAPVAAATIPWSTVCSMCV